MSKHVGEKCRKLCISHILSSQRGITPSKIDAKWWHSHLLCSTSKQSHVQNFSSICQGITPSKIDAKWWHSSLICSTLKQSHVQKFQLNMSKRVGESVENCISYILSPQRSITPSKIDAKWQHSSCSVVYQSKVMCKISAQYVRACRRKLRKTVYFLYSKFQKRHNSFKNWRKEMTLELAL